MKKMFLAAAAATALISTAAFASVTYDPISGMGFVGKGDVQVPLGWNNKQLQTNAGGVKFSYETSTDYTAVCTFITGEGTRGEQTHNIGHKVTTAVSSLVDHATRNNSNGKDGDITGFRLTGNGPVIESGEVPVVGGACMGNEGHDGTWSSVTAGDTTGGLSFTYGGNNYPLPITPVL